LIGLIEVNNNLPIKDTRYSDNKLLNKTGTFHINPATPIFLFLKCTVTFSDQVFDNITTLSPSIALGLLTLKLL